MTKNQRLAAEAAATLAADKAASEAVQIAAAEEEARLRIEKELAAAHEAAQIAEVRAAEEAAAETAAMKVAREAAEKRAAEQPKAVTQGQAYALARAYNLGGSRGFLNFVPGWKADWDIQNPGVLAAKMLTDNGCTHETAGKAIQYLTRSKPETDIGRFYRIDKARALLMNTAIPEAPAGVSPAVAAPPAPSLETATQTNRTVVRPGNKPEVSQLGRLELGLALAQLEIVELREQLRMTDKNRRQG